MTTSFPETKTGLRLGLASAAVTGCLAMVLLAGLPARAEEAKTGQARLAFWPSKKSIRRMVEKIHAMTEVGKKPQSWWTS